MERTTLVALGIGWTCAAVALFAVKYAGIENPAAAIICLLGGGAPTLIALNWNA